LAWIGQIWNDNGVRRQARDGDKVRNSAPQAGPLTGILRPVCHVSGNLVFVLGPGGVLLRDWFDVLIGVEPGICRIG